MKLLDRYIARLYLTNIVALTLALCGFTVGIDVVLNMKRFVSAAQDLAPEGASGVHVALLTALGVIDLWGPRLLQLLTYLTALVLVAAMGFTCASLVRRRELVAALASGVSLHRLAAPFLAVGIGVLAIAALNQELVLPRIAHLLPRGPNEAGQRSLEAVSVPLLRDGEGRLWHARLFDPNEQRMAGVSVWERDEAGRIERRFEAGSAEWTGRAWRLDDGSYETTEQRAAQPLPEGHEIRTDLDPTSILVRRVQGYGQNLSWRRISRTLELGGDRIDPQERRRLQTMQWGRPAVLTANFLGLVIALPFFLVRTPTSMTAQSLKCAPVVVLAMVGGALGAAAPLPGLPVQVGVFIPALALTPIAIAAVSLVRT